MSIWPKSGVRPGAHLVPLLYLLHANGFDELMDRLGVECSVYVDDTKMLRAIENEQDAASLQRAIHGLVERGAENRLHLNEVKTAYLTFYKLKLRFDTTFIIKMLNEDGNLAQRSWHHITGHVPFFEYIFSFTYMTFLHFLEWCMDMDNGHVPLLKHTFQFICALFPFVQRFMDTCPF